MNARATLALTATVTGSGGVVNEAEIVESHIKDPDSRPGNGRDGEDDLARATLTVQAPDARQVGQAPTAAAPDRFRIEPNYPNPFNPETVIPFAVPVAGPVCASKPAQWLKTC